ncbi:hypothetical protein QE152_g10153 [Popillia japonica]|uniref:Uncharacterized protein n=1 Tax=Popillia japonica TaxID=7064 RepID=A0AAW1LXB7_POPJA
MCGEIGKEVKAAESEEEDCILVILTTNFIFKLSGGSVQFFVSTKTFCLDVPSNSYTAMDERTDKQLLKCDDREFNSDVDYEPYPSSSSDWEQGNFLAEEIVEISLANTVGIDEKSNNGDATKDIDENPLEQKTDNNNTWEDTTSDIPNFQFDTTQSGIKINVFENMSPINVFEHIWDQHITDFIVTSTNNYGRALNQSNRPKTRHSRFREFKPIT